MIERVYLSAQALPEEALPTEFRIFQTGWNDTSKGQFLFDDEAAESVIADYEVQGNDLCIDYDHKAVDPDARAGDGRAAGWFQLEVRPDGLWAINVRWTPPAAEAIRNREWRYFSPAFIPDPETRRVLSVINLALTNIPATRHMQPLVAASAVPFSAYPIVNEPWDAKAALTRLRHWASTNGNNRKPLIDWAKFALGFGWVDAEAANHFYAYMLPHHDVRGGRMVTSREGVLAAGALLSRGGVDLPASDLDAVRAHLAGHYQELGVSPPWVQQENATMAKQNSGITNTETELDEADDESLTEDESVTELKGRKPPVEDDEAEEMSDDEELAAEDEADDSSDEEDDDEEEELPPKAKKKASRLADPDPAAATSLSTDASHLAIVAAAREFTGRTTPSEIIGALRAHRDARQQVTQLSARIQKLEGTIRVAKVRQVVASAIRAGKIAPAMRKWALGLGRQDLAQLRAYVEQAPPIVAMNQTVKPPPTSDNGQVITLSADELRVCELTGVSPAMYARHKSTGNVAKEVQ
ncbi:phage protease [Pendulispora brunnea]|uniref:Phage protease n=1 Tax=Pendulispora brunnea TaxID=2905690 RepID=A0ABZ2KB12_9BACT